MQQATGNRQQAKNAALFIPEKMLQADACGHIFGLLGTFATGYCEAVGHAGGSLPLLLGFENFDGQKPGSIKPGVLLRCERLRLLGSKTAIDDIMTGLDGLA